MENALKAYEEAQEKRPIYVFELGEEEQALNDSFVKKSIGLVKLTMNEELEALNIAKHDAGKAVYFALMKSLVEVDGRRVDRSNAEDERIVNNTDPVIRDLMISAQQSISGATKDSRDAFLKSRKVKVG